MLRELVRTHGRPVLDIVWAARYFVRTESAMAVRWRSPRMLVRGFHSDRRWLLPEGASRARGYVADFPYARRATG